MPGLPGSSGEECSNHPPQPRLRRGGPLTRTASSPAATYMCVVGGTEMPPLLPPYRSREWGALEPPPQ